MCGGPTRASSEPADLEIGAIAGDYIVAELLARGGCGAVYRALHAVTERAAAVKVLHASLAAQPKMVDRFAREVEVVNRLRHPGIVAIHEVGVLLDGRPFYAMEYLAGQTLGEVLRGRGRLTPEEVLAIFEPVCAALAAAHGAGVVHRDIKAGNVMIEVEPGGAAPRVKLLDFGLAKLLDRTESAGALTSEGRLLGTPTAMSPEQLRGRPIDARTDVYALGVLLFHALTASLPFDASTPGGLAHQHLVAPAPHPSDLAAVSPALDAVVLRCLEKQPEHRYASVEELVSALRRAVVAGRPEPPATRTAAAVAVYVEIRRRGAVDDGDDSTSEDVGAALDLAEEALSARGYLLALVTGTRVLAVRLLSTPKERALAERVEALAAAGSLRRALDERRGAHPAVHVNVCVHAGDVTLRAAGPLEVIGGPLARPDGWAPRGAVAGVYETREAVEGVPEISPPAR